MIEFFNAKMQEAKLNTAPGNPVIAAQINLEQNFAFIEVQTVNDFLGSIILIVMYTNVHVVYIKLIANRSVLERRTKVPVGTTSECRK